MAGTEQAALAQADADLEAGYGDETPTATPEPTPEPVVPEVKPAEQPVDPLKAVLDRLDKFEATSSKLAGHIGGLQRSQNEIHASLAAAKAATSAVDDAPTQAQVKDAVSNPKKWNSLKEEYPEWADATEEFLDSRIATLKAPQAIDPEAIAKIVQEQVAGTTSAMSGEIVKASLEAVFPGWEDERPQIMAWAAKQSDEVKTWVNSPNIRDAAKLLKLYYQPKPAPAAPKDVSTRQQRIEAAVNPRGTGGHAGGGSSALDDMEAGYSG
jgi:hypothetical protein